MVLNKITPLGSERDLKPWQAVLLLVSVGVVVGYNYFTHVHLANVGQRIDLHRQIVERTAGSPYRYRVLAPYVCEAGIRAASRFTTPRKAFHLTYAAYDMAAVIAALSALRLLLRGWFSELQSLLGLLFVAATMPIGLRDHYYQPWTLLEIAFMAVGLALIREGRRGALCLTIALATLNRETGLFLAMAFVFAQLPWERPTVASFAAAIRGTLLPGAVMFGVWLAVYGGLRLGLGKAEHVVDLEKQFEENLLPLNRVRTAWHVVWFLGGFWLFAILGYRRAPVLVRRVAWIVPCYVVTVMVFALWWEVRLLMPMYSILLPLGLSYLFPPSEPAQGDDETGGE